MLFENNLREIYRAVKQSPPEDLLLTANPSGTRLYHNKRLFGRAFSLLGKDWREKRVSQALVQTHNLFRQHLTIAENQGKLYRQYLDKAGKGYLVKESDVHSARRKITAWNRSTSPFVKLIKNDANFSRLEPLLSKAFPEHPETDLQLLFATPEALELSNIQKIIDLEGIAAGPLPLAIFKKVMRGKPLNLTESRDIDKWIAKVNKVKPFPRQVYKAFSALADLYRKKEEREAGTKGDPYNLEFFLQEKGLKAFLEDDPKHIEWRRQVKKGSQVTFAGASFILDEELHPDITGSDKTRVFTIEGQPDRVALFGCNRVALHLRDMKMRLSHHHGLEPVLMKEISPDGKVAIMERLTPLRNNPWTSQDGRLSVEDAPVVDTIAAFIAKLVKSKETPKDFSPSTLMFGSSHQLKIFKPTERGPFDFTALEQFIFTCAAGNITVFQALMTKSGLGRHAVANFYADLLKSHLKKDKIDIGDLAAIYKIADPKVVDQARLFVEKITAIKNEVWNKLRMDFPDIDTTTLDKKINEAIIECYKSFKGIGTVWVNAENVAERMKAEG